MKSTRLPPELQTAWEEIEGYAKEYQLDFFPIIYEVLDYRTLYETAALGGFPTRYPHWRFGMEYDQLMKGHVWLGSTIYEMVINTNPSYAYLLEGNDIVTQKMVMAHVTGHVDFFKNNMWFAHTNRKMLDEMANHASRIQRAIDRYGYEVVEDFIDVCLSLENLIDYHAPYIRRPEAQTPVAISGDYEEPITVEGLPVEREYMKEYINPPEFLARQRKRLEEEAARAKRFPENPQKDILLFLMNYAPLERWQHTILDVIRNEAYYFAPQGMTKILNEGWACVTAQSLVYTQAGVLTMGEIVNSRRPVLVGDGCDQRRVYDWAKFEDRQTVFIRTQRGFELEGSVTHRVMLPDGRWRRLDEVRIGEPVLLGAGPDVWAQEYVSLNWKSLHEVRLHNLAHQTSTDSEPIIRYRHNLWERQSQIVAPLGSAYHTDIATLETVQTRHSFVTIPSIVDEQLAAFLGYISSEQHTNEIEHTIGLTTGDEAQADYFATLVSTLFGVKAHKRWNAGHWQMSFSSQEIKNFLEHLGLTTSIVTQVPDSILRSPKSVVAAFLRALYDCDGDAHDAGLTLSTNSDRMSAMVQLLLLNFGILSSRQRESDGCWHLHTIGRSAGLFQSQIGFGSLRKQAALRRYVEDRQGVDQEDWSDEIVAIEQRRADVYDISVEETHRYAAQGFINHNSYWHTKIMTKRALRDDEVIDFAERHSGVVAISPGRLNPYKIGLELLRDVEERWDTGRFGKEYDECEDLREKKNWDRKLGLGRQKVFEIRRLYNDVTFIDEFLTPEFCLEQKLFTFRYNRDTDFYEIASREFKEIKEKLLFRLTNFGQPFIYVQDGNYNNRGELYLRHRHEGVDLKMDYARDTMRNIHKIWTRPVHVETLIDDKRRLISFDGKDFGERKLD